MAGRWRVFGLGAAMVVESVAGGAQTPNAPEPQGAARVGGEAQFAVPHSYSPLAPYQATHVPEPNLQNSIELDRMVHDGVLMLSLKDAIQLALADNLDLAIARYNLAIAQADVLRTRSGAPFRGVNTGVVQNTPGGGVGGFGSAPSGAGAGGTTGGAGGAGTGASGLVTSTLGTGTTVNSFDPLITSEVYTEHFTEPLANTVVSGVPSLRQNSIVGDVLYQQAFPTGTTLQVEFNNNRQTSNSGNNLLNPQINTYYQVQFQQQLLAGFGFGPNLRYLRIAKNNQRISDQAFELQVSTTVTQIANIYWDLVSAYEDEQVKSHSLDFARQTLETARKQLALAAIPALDVTKDEGEVANREEELSIAKSTLQFQELLIKNALTKNLDDPLLEAMPVRPTDLSEVSATTETAEAAAPSSDLMAEALTHRIELLESDVDLQNRAISNAATRNNLLPTLSLIGYYGGTGLGGPALSGSTTQSTAAPGYGGALTNEFNNSAPDYYVGMQLLVPLRNRLAKSDQYRAELESRQAELRLQQLRKQIRIEVRNAQYALEEARARVVAAEHARELAQHTFDITSKEQTLGAGSALQTLGAQHDLATADSALVAARTAFQKSKIELDRSLGRTLEANQISIESARLGGAGQVRRP